MLFSPGGGGAGILTYTQAQRDALPTPTSAVAIINSTSGRVQQYDLVSNLWRNVGDPLATNYILNWNAEGSLTTGWVTYADAAGVVPVDGTGGSPTVTWNVSTTTPLRNISDFNFVKDAANRQGEGVSYNFTIDRADQGRQLAINFDYEVVSGTFASGDMTVWVYDVTNSVLLPQPSGNSIISTSIPSQQGQCTFQTAINSTSYRLIFHVTTTSASAYTLAFDNVSVGPQVQASGSVDTAWASYTPTFTGFGTATSVEFVWRREGPDAIILGKFTAGTATATEARITLPTGLVSADTSVLASIKRAGDGNNASASATYFSHFAVLIEPSTAYMTFGTESSTTNGTAKANGSAVSGNTVLNEFIARIPIAGWASNTVLSTSANTRLVDFSAFKNGGSVTTSTTIASWTVVEKDTVAGFNATTGVYTVQVPGDYFIHASAGFTATSVSFLNLRKNGSSFIISNDSSASQFEVNVLMPSLVVGDTISFDNSTNRTLASSNTQTKFNIYMLQGPQQIAASESINARYFASATSISGSLATIVWTTKDFDTHNAMSAGVYTIPAPGKYQVNSNVQTLGTIALNSTVDMQLQKNGTVVSEFQTYAGGAMTAQNGQISDIIQGVAGDTVRIQLSSSATLPTITVSNTKVFFSIARVGS